ncbi:ABC transporter substrate-binding protein [Niveibacterium umoris]|uniref:Dipeptide transport system substrate-binding protein n=1 Tax=Niveibacterium umoris TaxID=1193620 RepID=A0A840BNR3_9RHOO|nr:ABC transporter substrate-binding protein [Niveibacterium umoris]MBB4013178.1 dipeptide transport system substrate-binding protein [Niveibacterium umoris]
MRRTLAPFLLAALLIPAVAHAAKTLVYCAEGSPESLTRLFANGQNTADAGAQVADTLLDFKPGTAELQPALAESWEISPDGLAYTFHLRRGVKFHSSATFKPTRDFNADDVLFTWNRQADKSHPYHTLAGNLAYVQFNNLRMDENVDKLEKLDANTIRFRLKTPEAPFLTRMSFDMLGIQSAEYAAQMSAAGTPDKLDREPVGTGPFQFVSYQKDAAIRYKAFADHWRGKPKLDNLIFAIVPDAAVQLAKLRTGECHVSTSVKPADIAQIEKEPALTLVQQPGLNVGYLALNTQKKPFNDKRVRQALNLAIDRSTILSAIYQGRALVAKNLLPPAYWAANAKLSALAYDPAKAKALLAGAGYPNGFDMELWYLPVLRPHNPDGKRMAELLQADFAKIGVRVKLATYEWGEYLKRSRAGEHQAVMFGWLSGNGEPDNYFEPLLSCDAAKSGGNLARWCDPRFEDLLQRARKISDRSERARLYATAQEILRDESPLLLIAHGNRVGVTRKEVSGFLLEPTYGLNFYNVDLNR